MIKWLVVISTVHNSYVGKELTLKIKTSSLGYCVDATARPRLERFVKLLLRLRAANVACVPRFYGVYITKTKAPGGIFCYRVFQESIEHTEMSFFDFIVAEKDAARRARPYLNLVLAYEEASRAGVSFIPEFWNIGYKDALFEEPILYVEERPVSSTIYPERKVLSLFTENGFPHGFVDGKLIYSQIYDLACMILAYEFCHLNGCKDDQYMHFRRGLCPFDFSHPKLLGKALEYSPLFTPDICREKSEQFASNNRLYRFLADYTRKGVVLNETFDELREGLREFLAND